MIRQRLFSVIYMFVLTLFFTGLVSGVNVVNQKRIELNRKTKLQKIILNVLGVELESRISDDEISRIFNKRVRKVSKNGKYVYQGYSENGTTLTGYAFPLLGAGFWGPVFGMMAVDPNRKSIGNFFLPSQ